MDRTNRLLTVFIGVMIASNVLSGAESPDLRVQKILTRTTGKPHAISREDAIFILELPVSKLKKQLSAVFEDYSCRDGSHIPSQEAVLLTTLIQDVDLSGKVKKLRSCEEKLSTELLPCEYFCAYEFVDKIKRIQNGTVKEVQVTKTDTVYAGNLSIDDVLPYLKDLDQNKLIKSMDDISLRPIIPKFRPDVLQHAYIDASIYQICTKFRNPKTKMYLLQRLLVLYGIDASGEGVNQIQQCIYSLETPKNRVKSGY